MPESHHPSYHGQVQRPHRPLQNSEQPELPRKRPVPPGKRRVTRKVYRTQPRHYFLYEPVASRLRERRKILLGDPRSPQAQRRAAGGSFWTRYLSHFFKTMKDFFYLGLFTLEAAWKLPLLLFRSSSSLLMRSLVSLTHGAISAIKLFHPTNILIVARSIPRLALMNGRKMLLAAGWGCILGFALYAGFQLWEFFKPELLPRLQQFTPTSEYFSSFHLPSPTSQSALFGYSSNYYSIPFTNYQIPLPSAETLYRALNWFSFRKVGQFASGFLWFLET